ncbi:fibrobacter succinogenes major paralogous domain-containing protein [uncultured Fibrobacter sp.]|uniref:fibrobacter succinogenes major paralogous domain-containing protein n=1 Tax=uncultured Fibrobacter sp. TaxID=261512 RepID=UPI0025E69A89|nr:fibrobacter succinogenes major paralogous domain-containing protein [uncultured Fibrobacter sp.]
MKGLVHKILSPGLFAVCAAFFIGALSACTDYVAQMEGDFDAWVRAQGDEVPSQWEYVPTSSNGDVSYVSSSSVSVVDLGDSFLDPRDNSIYKKVKIGAQVWMAENLNYATDNSYCYGNNYLYCSIFGRLYTWSEAMSVCPVGWHLPSNDDWETLYAIAGAVGGDEISGYQLKSVDSWEEGGTGSDYFGFTAYPAGLLSNELEYVNMRYVTAFWSSTMTDNGVGFAAALMYNTADLFYINDFVPSNAVSVRCIQD